MRARPETKHPTSRPADGGVVIELVFEEIERMVADAIRDRSFLSATISAESILRTYPGCALSERELADQITMFAASAGVPIEFGRHARPIARSADAGETKAHGASSIG